ncbi:MAG: hypothetical protein SGPRY_009950, partial [Prymnesium sp.]
MFALLDEECVFPKGNAANLVGKWKAANSNNPRLLPSPKAGGETLFCVGHFALDVTYDAADFIHKNRDPLSEDQQVVMRRSAQPLVANMFAKDAQPASRMRGGF